MAIGNTRTDEFAQLFGNWSLPDAMKVDNLELTIDRKMLQDGALKQQLISQPGNSKIYLSQLLMNLSLEGQQGAKNITEQDERLRQQRVAFLRVAAVRRGLSEEALAAFVQMKDHKKALRAFRDYILKNFEENYQRMLAEYINEKEKLDAKLHEMMLAELDRIRQEIEESIDYHTRQINSHHAGIANAHREASFVFDKHAQDYKNVLDTSMRQSPAAEVWFEIPDEKRVQFVKEILEEDFKDSIEMEHLQNMIALEEQNLESCKGKLLSLEPPPLKSHDDPNLEQRAFTAHHKYEQEKGKTHEYKLLNKEKTGIISKLEGLNNELNKLQEKQHSKKDDQVKRIGETVFGKEKMKELLRDDPQFVSRIETSEFQQLKNKVKEEVREHREQIVHGKKQIAHHEGELNKTLKASESVDNHSRVDLGITLNRPQVKTQPKMDLSSW